MQLNIHKISVTLFHVLMSFHGLMLSRRELFFTGPSNPEKKKNVFMFFYEDEQIFVHTSLSLT